MISASPSNTPAALALLDAPRRSPKWALDAPCTDESLARRLGARPGRGLPGLRVRSDRQSRRARLEGTDDLALLESVLAKDELAFEVFQARFRRLITACAVRVCLRGGVKARGPDVDDIVAEAFVNMVAGDFRRLRLYRPDGGCSVSSWVGVIASSTAHDHLRRERRRPLDFLLDSELERVAPMADGPDVELIHRQQRAFVDQALASLSRRDRRFVELYYAEAMSPDDIAREMQVSVSTVYSKKAKIKSRLRELARVEA